MDFLKQEEYKNGYQNGRFSAPRETNPDKKSPQNKHHYLAAARYFWGCYCSNNAAIGFGGSVHGRSIGTLRDYGMNRLDSSKFREQIDPKWKTAPLVHISWDTLDIYTKIRNIAISRIQAFNFKPIVRAMNERALEERQIQTNKEKLKFTPQMQQMSAAFDESVTSDFEDAESVDIYAQHGGFAIETEIALKDAIDDTLNEDGDDVIRDQLIRDIIDLNVCCRLVEYCPFERRIKEHYVDPATTFWSPSAYLDTRDKWYAGTWSLMTVGDLRGYLMQTGQYDSEAEDLLEKCCRGFVGFSQNAYPSAFTNNQYATRESYAAEFGVFHYDHFKVPVMTAFWRDVDSNTFVTGQRMEGNSVFTKIKTSDIDKVSKSKQSKMYVSKEIENINIPMVRKVKWIIGTNFVFDCGVDSAIARFGKEGNKIAQIPLSIYHNPEPSITARCIPAIDELQMVTFKIRNAWSNIASATIDIYDLKLLESVIQMGSETMSFMELIGMYKATGTLITMSKSEQGDPELGSNRPPVLIQANPAIDGILRLRQIWLGHIDDLRALSGVNEMSDGTQQSPEMLVGVGQMLEQSTNNALKPYIDAIRYNTESTYRLIAYKYQSAVAYGDIERVYFREQTQKKYRLDKRIASYEYNVSVFAGLNNEQKQAVIAYLQEQKQLGKLTPDNVIKATMFIINDDLAKANLYLAHAAQQAEKRAQQQTIEQMNAQAKAQSESATIISQQRIAEIQAKAQADMELEKLKHQNKMAEISLQIREKSNADASLSTQNNIQQMIGNQKDDNL